MGLVIYGTGDFGKKLYSILKKWETDIIFCKSQAKENELCEGREVICVEQLVSNTDKQIPIVIAIKDRAAVSNIRKMLIEKGFLPQYVLDMGSFFQENVIVQRDLEDQKGKKKYCLACKNKIGDFRPAGENTGLFVQHHVIGGGYRKQALCPICGSLDRERWQHYVIEHETNILSKPCRVLHIAPEPSIYRLIRLNSHCDYYTGDIGLGRAMHQVDLTHIQFCDHFFDYIIANHVFEHILDEGRMFLEIKRVLKPEGKLICSFPVCMDMDTYDNPKLSSKSERLKYYGQEDHVRLYGRDFKKHIEQYGFQVEVKSPISKLGMDKIETYGLIGDDIILICGKYRTGEGYGSD